MQPGKGFAPQSGRTAAVLAAATRGPGPTTRLHQPPQLPRELARGTHHLTPAGPGREPPVDGGHPIPAVVVRAGARIAVPRPPVQLHEQAQRGIPTIVATGAGVLLALPQRQPVWTEHTLDEAQLQHTLGAGSGRRQHLDQTGAPALPSPARQCQPQRRGGGALGRNRLDDDGDRGVQRHRVGQVEHRVLDRSSPGPGGRVQPLLQEPTAVQSDPRSRSDSAPMVHKEIDDLWGWAQTLQEGRAAMRRCRRTEDQPITRWARGRRDLSDREHRRDGPHAHVISPDGREIDAGRHQLPAPGAHPPKDLLVGEPASCAWAGRVSPHCCSTNCCLAACDRGRPRCHPGVSSGGGARWRAGRVARHGRYAACAPRVAGHPQARPFGHLGSFLSAPLPRKLPKPDESHG